MKQQRFDDQGWPVFIIGVILIVGILLLRRDQRISSHGAMIGLMVVASVVIGYYTMTALISTNRTDNRNKHYQALLMGLLMGAVEVGGVILLGSHVRGAPIMLAGLLLGAILLLTMIRRQTGIDDVQFALSMIEHHQMAITMAERILARSTDGEIRALAETIIRTQTEEIAKMRAIAECLRTSSPA